MLSRVAEALYWMSRYIERAEDITRMLSVNFDAMLETELEDEQLGWLPLIAASADQQIFHACFDKASAATATEFLLWHPANTNAVLACIMRARENARTVREQISSEMWAHINRLYFMVQDVNRAEVLRGPHEFFVQVRDGSQAFQGITTATMTHGEAYDFIQLGKFIERATETVYTLDMKYAVVNTLREGSPEANIQLIAMLKSCSAFEPFRRSHAAQMQAWRVAEYLLLSQEFPRAVCFCLHHCLEYVNAICGSRAEPVVTGLGRTTAGQLTPPQRAFGRLGAELEYLDIHEVLGDRFHGYLDQLQHRIGLAGEEVARTFFNTQVILPEAERQPSQQQQQQQ
jgi:uncharacterized alpha-E superfamily protein